MGSEEEGDEVRMGAFITYGCFNHLSDFLL